MDLGILFSIIIGTVFINNFIFTRFLGICPFIDGAREVNRSLGMGMAVTFVMTVSSAVTWLLYYRVLMPLKATYLMTIMFILVIASLVQFTESVIKRVSPSLYRAFGVFLPLVTTNCAVLGVAIININERVNEKNYTFIEAVLNGFFSAVGFTLALYLMASIRERLEYSDIPESFRGIAVAFIAAGILAMAFMGFSGIKI
jgi:electron transport complex protein RnfA